MFVYEKKLQYPVRIKNPNPALAKFIISQYGGPNGKWICKIAKKSGHFLNIIYNNICVFCMKYGKHREKKGNTCLRSV